MQKFIEETIIVAGNAVMALFGKENTVRTKSNITDIVTKADMDSNEIIVSAIKKRYPTHGIVSEEVPAYNIDADYLWYIDPVDGTRNFASRVPIFGLNIALAYKDEIQLAAIYIPASKELCLASLGKGTYLNGRKVRCSRKKEWEGTYGIGPIRPGPKYFELQKVILAASNMTAWINAIASTAVSAVYMADGRRDWYFTPSKNSWDLAAPYLITKEAGCTVSNMKGKDWKPGDRGLVIANKSLHHDLVEMIKEIYID